MNKITMGVHGSLGSQGAWSPTPSS